MKTTPVEWLEKELNAIRLDVDKNVLKFIDKSFEIAKEMEKQQIIDAYDEGYGTRDAFGDVTENNTGEQHYTETYGKQIKTL